MKLKIAITGSTGMIGSYLVKTFKSQGHFITRIVREKPSSNSHDALVYWNIRRREMETAGLEGHDLVIHLAGASIAGHRWTKAYKDTIYNSRVDGTRLLCENLAKLTYPPKLLISTSAVGYYGHHAPDVRLDESSPAGHDFLAGVCRAWELAAAPAIEKNIRVIHLRLGPVLSQSGGMLGKILPIFKMGLGGKVGSGKQMFSWVALDEIPYIINYLVDSPGLTGPVNAVAPETVSNEVFTKVLGHVIKRPTVFPLPAPIVHLMFGEMGESLLLSGARVCPERLLTGGYRFRYGNLEAALRHLLT